MKTASNEELAVAKGRVASLTKQLCAAQQTVIDQARMIAKLRSQFQYASDQNVALQARLSGSMSLL